MSSSSRKRRSVNRMVRGAYRQDDLARVLTMPERDFGKEFGMETVEVKREAGYVKGFTYEPDGDHFHFRDNGARVLAVAHLDTVVAADRRAPRFYGTQAGPAVQSGALDDRLGAYVILKMLPALGIRTDVLLTTGEESGESTASEFEAGKDYDHVIEFDRGGTDVVMYQYDDAASRRAVQACGAPVGLGSFSDIAFMEHLGVKAFNWGAGYTGSYHSERGYAPLGDTFAMVAKYLRFSEQNAGRPMPHEQQEDGWHSSRRRSYADDEAGYLKWLASDMAECQVCWSLAVDRETEVCIECGSCNDCLAKEDDCMCYTSHALSGRPLSDDPQAREYEKDAAEYNTLFGSVPLFGGPAEAGWLADAAARAEA